MTIGRRAAGWTCAIMAAGLLAAGWWPFRFLPQNGAAWVPGAAGLRFERSAIAYTPADWPRFPGASTTGPGAPVTLELWLRADSESKTDCFPILTIDAGRSPANLALCQFHDGLRLRVPRPTAAQGFDEAVIEQVLPVGRPRIVALTTDAAGTTFYVDGVWKKGFPGFVLPADTWSGQLLLGASVDHGPSWTGTLFGLSAVNRVLDGDEVAADGRAWTRRQTDRLAATPGIAALFLFDEGQGAWASDAARRAPTLFLPASYRLPRPRVLRMPSRDRPIRWSSLDDVLVNMLGFMPFGFMLCHYRRLALRGASGVVWAVAVAGAVSLTIEVFQAWLPGRYSSAADVGLNVTGALLGAFAARRVPTFHAEEPVSRP